MNNPQNENTRPAIAFIVAHPDDVALSMGGTALLLKDKYKLHVICASKGERGYKWEGKGLPPPIPEVAAEREKNELAACAMIGAELSFLGEMDGEIFASRSACENVGGILTRIRPVAVFTHWPLEKTDHAATWGIVYRALELASLFWTTELYMSAMAGDDRRGPNPDIYVNISAVFQQKMEMCRCHKRHGDHFVNYLTQYNGILGKQVWCDYAEAYATGLPLMSTRWNRKAGSILLDLNQQPTGQ